MRVDRLPELEFNAWVPVVAITDDADAVAEMVAPGFGLDPEQATEALESPMALIGTEDEIAERLEQRRDRWGFSYFVVQNDAARPWRRSSPGSPATEPPDRTQDVRTAATER